MSPLRTLIVLVVFVALGVIEIWSGFSRISALREGRRAELVETTRREHADVASRLAALVERARRQAGYLASLEVVADLLAAPTGDTDAPAEVRGFLLAFEDVDALRLLDGSDALRLELARGADGVVRDGAANASVSPWLAADVVRDGQRLGGVRVRLSLPPFERVVSASHALAGVSDRIRPASTTDVGDEELDAEGLRLRSRLQGEPSLALETLLPHAVLDAAMQPLSQEYGWIVGSMIAFTAFVLLMGAIVLRLSQRAFRLRETEHYLRWIRRVTDRYRALMEGAADMILIVGPDGGVIREANAAAREALGLPELGVAPGVGVAGAPATAEVGDGARLGELLTGDGQGRLASALAEVSARGGRVALSGLRLRAASGRLLDVDTGLARVDLGVERVVQVSLRDVTQQREMERQLQTAERLGSLGLLTAGVAHEINNPLEGIGNYLVLAERAGVDDDKRARYLGEVRRGLARIRDIVQDLLSFARPAAASGRADLAQVVESALGLSHYALDVRGVVVTRVGLEQPLLVPGDAGRLEQVVLNLVLNAARAMDGKGALQIAACRVVEDDGAFVELSVADEGPGIPPDDLAHIFDPFFGRSAGTGLGLTVSFGIARAHGGTLSARNRPEGGALFSLRLPADADEAPSPEPAAGDLR